MVHSPCFGYQLYPVLDVPCKADENFKVIWQGSVCKIDAVNDTSQFFVVFFFVDVLISTQSSDLMGFQTTEVINFNACFRTGKWVFFSNNLRKCGLFY